MTLKTLVVAFLVATIAVTDGAKEKMDSSDDYLRTKLVDLQHRHVDWLLDHPDVTAVDVNHKTVGGEQTDQLSLVIWVKQKLPEEEVAKNRRLPREIEGFQTDVVEGEIQLVSGTCTCRPSLGDLRGGHCIKIKNSNSQVGTLGYFTVRTSNASDIGILSNCHVTGEIGNRIATNNRRLTSTGGTGTAPSVQHYAAEVTVAECDATVDASHLTLCTDPPTFMLKDGTVVEGTETASLGGSARFCGCASGCVDSGTITSIDFCTNVECTGCNSGSFTRCNQILFTPAPQDCDSGSLLINPGTNNAIGLVYAAANSTHGVATPIADVLTALGVDLAGVMPQTVTTPIIPITRPIR